MTQERQKHRDISPILEIDTNRYETRYSVMPKDFDGLLLPELLNSGFTEKIYPTPAFQTIYFGPGEKRFPHGIALKFRTYSSGENPPKNVMLIPPEQTGIFEVKVAPDPFNRSWRTKQRIEISFDELLRHLSSADIIQKLEEYHLDTTSLYETFIKESCRSLVPIAATKYIRRHFISPDEKIRITIDSNISFWETYLAHYNYYALKKTTKEQSVLEIKNKQNTLKDQPQLLTLIAHVAQPSLSKAENLMQLIPHSPSISIANPDETITKDEQKTTEREIKFQINDGTVDPRPILKNIEPPKGSAMEFISERISVTDQRFLVVNGATNGICFLGIPGNKQGTKMKYKIAQPNNNDLIVREEIIVDVTMDNFQTALERMGMNPQDAKYLYPFVSGISPSFHYKNYTLTPYFKRHRLTRRLYNHRTDIGMGFMFYIEADHCVITDPKISYTPLNQLEIEHGGILFNTDTPVDQERIMTLLHEEYQEAIDVVTAEYQKIGYQIKPWDITKCRWISGCNF